MTGDSNDRIFMIRFKTPFLPWSTAISPYFSEMASESIGWVLLVLSMNDNASREKNDKGFKTFSVPSVKF